MKKCSTAALLLAAALSVPTAHAGRACEFLPGAPVVHRVQPGDTLWGIASLFLQDPWCWTRVWEGNREQVANPHRIYPGQRIVLDRQAGRLRTIAGGPAAGVPTSTPAEVRLGPAARVVATPQPQAIPAVAPALLQSAARFRLVTAAAIAAAPRIRGFADGRHIAGPGDRALVDGEVAPGSVFEVMRVLGPVSDTANAAAPALPLLRIGTASYLRRHEAGLYHLLIGPTRAEVMAGDLLMHAPASTATVTTLRPAPACAGKIIALLNEGERGGPGDIVLLEPGRGAGLDSGSLVAVTRQVRIDPDDPRQASHAITEPVATLLVFDTLEHRALALVLQGKDAVGPGDAIGALPAPD